MEHNTQAELFKSTNKNSGATERLAASEAEHGPVRGANATAIVARGIGDNLWVPANDIQIEGGISERRFHREDDIEKASLLIAEGAQISPIPVVLKDDRFYAVDSSTIVRAAQRAEIKVRVTIVDPEEAQRIRASNLRKGALREPMGIARLACARKEHGETQAKTATALGVSEGRVSQLIEAARGEKWFPELPACIANPETVSVDFWRAVDKTVVSAEANDEAKPQSGSTSRLDEFKARVREYIASGKVLSANELKLHLKLDHLRAPKGSSKRQDGPIIIAGATEPGKVSFTKHGGSTWVLPPLSPQACNKIRTQILKIAAADLEASAKTQKI